MAHAKSLAMGAISTAMFGPLVITYAVPPRAVVCFPPCESVSILLQAHVWFCFEASYLKR